jgi:hypothetical protein
LWGWSSRDEQHGGKVFLDMPEMTFVAPLLPNKEEEWRRFVQEVIEERLQEYGEFRQRLGIRNESVWLARTKRGETAIVYLEAEDPERILPALARSKKPFDSWFKGRLLECHGGDVVHKPSKAVAQLIFASQYILEDRPPASSEEEPA